VVPRQHDHQLAAWRNPGGGWRSYRGNITSVYNNTHSIVWAPFHSFIIGNYYAYNGSPARYVGAYWNDMFDDACAC
jgi:hypothetical protein